MAKSRSKVFGYAVVAAVALFFAIDIIAGFACPDLWAFNAAMAVFQQNGWQPDDFSEGKAGISGGLIGKIATIEFKPKNQTRCKAIHITLRKPINLLPWKLMDYAEEPNQP